MPTEHDIRFSPGDVLAGCFRIQKFLGGGGMGNVYRAHNMNLGIPVALKVPRSSHAGHAALETRLFGEGEKALGVAHPNVCRVHGVVKDHEHDVFLLSMELLEGQTLQQLLKDPSRDLSPNERVRLAHGICAGLAAIHDKDIVHRDLKPSNIMIDSEGLPKILDFGLAAKTGELTQPEDGSYDYMAPELRNGGQPSKQSDLYALGLVLYQLFTGKSLDPPGQRAVRGDLVTALTGGRIWMGPASPVKPPLAQQLLRCLEENPEQRPGAVEDVVRALPPMSLIPTEVDRLLEEPPGDLRPRAAWACLGATCLGLLLVAWLSQYTQPAQAALAGEPPGELEIRAREILVQAGFDGAHKDRRFGFAYEPDPEHPVRFWYRQSPRRLGPWHKGSAFQRYDDPPLATPGEVGVHLDPEGRLVRLDAVPRETGVEGSGTDVTWSPLLRAAGLDLDRLEPAAPEWIPPVFADRRAAWVESRHEPSATPIRIEAAALRGRPVGFRAQSSGSAPVRTRATAEDAPRSAWPVGTLLYCLGFGGMLIGVSWLAWCRLREHVADRPAAFRLAVFVFAARLLVGLFGSAHRWNPIELDLALAVLSRALLSATLVWVIYIGVEPWVRLYSPRRAASWVRLMYGKLPDRLVGRDLLVGGLFGVALLLWARLYVLIPSRLGMTPPRPDRVSTLVGMLGQEEIELQMLALGSFPRALAATTYALVHGVGVAFLLVTALVLARWVLRNPWLSRTAGFLLYGALIFPGAGHPALDAVAALGTAALVFTVLFRFGFLATVTTMAFTWVLSSHPLTLDPTSWTFAGALVPLLLILGISVWGFRASVGAWPLPPARLPRLRLRTG